MDNKYLHKSYDIIVNNQTNLKEKKRNEKK
jgi:hypothetical protein